MLNWTRVEELIQEGYISRRRHPTLPLSILNYTDKTQWERNWTPETMACRGLIVDDDGLIVARPFGKFFNYDELLSDPALDTEFKKLNQCLTAKMPFVVEEKLDGSLIIVSDYKGEMVVASRGSFDSEQALIADAILKIDSYRLWHPLPGITYMFEVIYPENRIVVDYGDMFDLIMLARVITATGTDLLPKAHPFEIAGCYDMTDHIDVVNHPDLDNKEGFVVRFANGFRFKVKFEEYKRLHRLICGVSTLRVWEMLRNGEDITQLADRVPDEWYAWVVSEADILQQSCDLIRERAEAVVNELRALPQPMDRAACAQWLIARAPDAQWKGVYFLLLDGKDPSELIWKMVRPKDNQFYRKDEG